MDNVKCCNCSFRGLVNGGEEVCPECKMDGSLAWIEGEPQEVDGCTQDYMEAQEGEPVYYNSSK